MKGELEVADNLIDNLMIFNTGDDSHLASAAKAQHRINFINFTDHLRPSLRGAMGY